ncbi:hypothetical protein J7L48_09975 [bacterium]|nr:hypothetical protein [bacterium]
MEDRLGKYILISLLIHIILILAFLKLNIFSSFIPKINEIEILQLSDLTFPNESKDIPRPLSNTGNFNNLRDLSDSIFQNNIITDNSILDDTPIGPTEKISIPLIQPPTKIEKNKTKITMKSDVNHEEDLNNDILSLEKELSKKTQNNKKSNFTIISKKLEGRKLIKKGEIPKDLHFSKNEKIILGFEVVPEGNIENIVPETLSSTDNLNVAINILNQFKWEPIKDGKKIKAQIIFYFKVE